MLPEGATVQRWLVVDDCKDGRQHAEEQHEEEHCQVEVVGSAERSRTTQQRSFQSLNECIHITTTVDGTGLLQGPGETVHLVKCLLRKREDLSLIPRTGVKRLQWAAHLKSKQCGGRNRRVPAGYCPGWQSLGGE